MGNVDKTGFKSSISGVTVIVCVVKVIGLKYYFFFIYSERKGEERYTKSRGIRKVKVY